MPRRWTNGGTGTILLRDINETKVKEDSEWEKSEKERRNANRDICLKCVQKSCKGNCKAFHDLEKKRKGKYEDNKETEGTR